MERAAFLSKCNFSLNLVSFNQLNPPPPKGLQFIQKRAKVPANYKMRSGMHKRQFAFKSLPCHPSLCGICEKGGGSANRSTKLGQNCIFDHAYLPSINLFVVG